MKKLLPNAIAMICALALFTVNLSGNNPNENFCFDADVPEAQDNLAAMCLTAPFIMCPSTYLGCPNDNLDPSITGTATATPGDANCPTPVLSYTDVVTTNTACLKVVHRTWEATYPPGSGNIKLHSSCQQTLYLEDTSAPTISNCPADITVDLANNCDGIATWALPTAADDCGLLFFTTTHFSGTAFPLGTTTVTYTAQDNCGQQSACSFNVTVAGSCCTGPTITCPNNYIVCPGGSLAPSVTGTATATQPDPTCPSPTVTHSDAVLQNGGACGMSLLRTWTATDGTYTTSCSQSVSNLDVQIPVITNFPGDMTFTGTGAGCSAVATWSTPNATDNCGVSSFTSTHQSGTTFPTGSTLVTYTALDNCGNQTTAAFQVTVTCTTPCSNPTINCPGTYTACPSSTVPSTAISGNASASASSGCTSGAPIVTHSDVVNSSGPCAGQQQILRTFTATDAANSNLVSSCTQTINMIDNVAPTITNVPSNISVSGTGTGCQVPVTWNTPTANDACGVAMLTSNISSGMTFSSGTTTIIYTAVDNCGNTNTASFTVTVTCSAPTCNVPPTISCPTTYTACPTSTVSPSISGFATAVSGGANCGTPGVTYSDVLSNSGSCANSKVIQRTWIANDPVSGLNSSCVQSINLIDNTAPYFTTSCPSSITLTGTGNNCSAAATFTIPAAADLCSSATVVGTSNGQVVTSGSTFTQGTHLVTYTATDNCGNFATCAFNVTVNCQGCNTNPIISCPSSSTVCVGTSTHPTNLGQASATAGAFCPTPTVNYSDVVTSSGPCAGAQVIQRTWTATYPNQGGYSASCVQMITLTDNVAPVLTNCPNNVTVNSSSTPVTWIAPTATDACGNAHVASNFNSGSTFPNGTTTVVYTATDNCGNATNCSFTVTVNAPQGGFANCPSDMTVQCGGSGTTVANWNVPTYNGACTSCDNGAYIPGFIYMGSYNGSQYYCSLSPATWPTAKGVCESYGGHLADVNSAGENAHLASQLTIQSAWIGLSDFDNEGTFAWCSGAPVTYTNWYQGQPNNYNNQQDYVELMNNGQWNDQYNSYSLEYIMEIPCSVVTQIEGPAPGSSLQAGTYRVSYSVQDACGGFATCTFNVTVEAGLTVTCPADITVAAPTAAGIACTWDEPTSYSCCNNCNNTGGAIPGFVYMGSYNGSQYYCSLSGASWPTAQQTCVNNGGHLAVINSEGENNFLANIIPLASAWIGCSDIGSEGNFSWVNGDPLTYTNWYAGQPNNYNGAQHCVELLNDGAWNDQYSSIALEYIMEISDCITTTQTAGPTPGTVCTPGTHTVSYTVQDGCGNVKTCSFDINVTAPAGGGGNGHCNAGGINSTNHYINACGFGTISNTSGNNGGYHDYTNQCTTVDAGTSYPLQLTPGFGNGKPHKVYWTVWIDYNMDGDFYDNYEFVAYGCGNKTLSGTVTIPYGVWNGTTTMRVSMKLGGYATDPCETFLYGETEDYCVTITGGDFTPGDDITLRESPTSEGAIELTNAESLETGISVYPNPVSNMMTLNIENVDEVEDVQLFSIDGKLIRDIRDLNYSTQVNATDLENGIYVLRAKYTDGTIITERVIVQH